MRIVTAVASVATILLMVGGSAQAAPLSVPSFSSGDIVTVSGGCGPRGFRAANGRCYPVRRPPPRFVRGCPPGSHPTPYGCRRNY